MKEVIKNLENSINKLDTYDFENEVKNILNKYSIEEIMEYYLEKVFEKSKDRVRKFIIREIVYYEIKRRIKINGDLLNKKEVRANGK